MPTLPNVHPGEVLLYDFMEPLGLSRNALGRELGVPANRVTAIVAGDRAVSADTALRLARYFGTTPQFWLNLQALYDLEEAERSSADALRRIEWHPEVAEPTAEPEPGRMAADVPSILLAERPAGSFVDLFPSGTEVDVSYGLPG